MPLHEGLRPQLRALARNGAPSGCHPGVWLDHFLTEQTWHQDETPAGYDKERARNAKDKLVQDVVALPLADGYRQAYDGWKSDLLQECTRIVVATGKCMGRVVVGIGQKGPAEFGLTLHHTWGVPVLPGSSLKGIAALGADRFLKDETWRRRPEAALAREGGPNAFDGLFGDVEEQGAVIFHDAWFVPGTAARNGLHQDVLTVHHPDYYRNGAAPSDTDSPTPVSFVSVRGHFLVCLEMSPALDPATHGHWLEAAWTALGEGLRRHGVGAKTNAGYGRVNLPKFSETDFSLRLDQERAQEKAAQEQAGRAARAAEQQARVHARAQRPTMPSASERIRSVVEDEGPDELFAWLLSNGRPALGGIRFDQDHVIAAAHAIRDAEGTERLARVTGPASGWVKAALKGPAGGDGAGRVTGGVRWTDDELTRKLARFTKNKDWNGAARDFLKAGLDDDTLRRATERLASQDGCKPGHIKGLQEELDRRQARVP